MSNDEYQHKKFFEEQKPVCIEKDDKGNCLMSAQWVLLDFSEPKVPFCEQLKEKPNEATKN